MLCIDKALDQLAIAALAGVAAFIRLSASEPVIVMILPQRARRMAGKALSVRRRAVVGAATAADFAVIKDWGTKTQSIDTARMLSFEPISFQWQAMRLRVPLPETTRWQPMQHWFWRWFKEDAGDHNEAFAGAVHFLSDPEVSDDGVTFAVDLGTAPVEAFEGLLDALEMMGATHCEIGHPV